MPRNYERIGTSGSNEDLIPVVVEYSFTRKNLSNTSLRNPGGDTLYTIETVKRHKTIYKQLTDGTGERRVLATFGWHAFTPNTVTLNEEAPRLVRDYMPHPGRKSPHYPRIFHCRGENWLWKSTFSPEVCIELYNADGKSVARYKRNTEFTFGESTKTACLIVDQDIIDVLDEILVGLVIVDHDMKSR